jgi:hypothetical protein
MIINWDKNPLHTTIELDEYEQKELWYKIKIAEMEELLFNTHFYLQEGKYFNLEDARKQANASYYLSDDDNKRSDLDQRCDDMLKYYLIELQSFHSGDCTCVACSCSKCHAETLLGIDTIKGLGKHSAYKIDEAFGKHNEKTIDQALDSLANYDVVRAGSWLKYPKEDFDQHVPRWKEEAKLAYQWLKQYKQEHFS